jgi:hypothetical protein
VKDISVVFVEAYIAFLILIIWFLWRFGEER